MAAVQRKDFGVMSPYINPGYVVPSENSLEDYRRRLTAGGSAFSFGQTPDVGSQILATVTSTPVLILAGLVVAYLIFFKGTDDEEVDGE